MENLESVGRRMREDWDWRAQEDAPFFVAFGRRRQSRGEFLSSAADVLHTLREDLRRFPPGTNFRELTALEIGCGPARLMLALSEIFGFIEGVDVSGEMVRLARENLAHLENVRVRQNSGSDLEGVADDSIDFCYSYAVFQHIPEKQVVWSYLREACRVLKVGGILKCQFNGLLHARSADEPQPVTGWSLRAGSLSKLPWPVCEADTWSGISFCPEEIAEFAVENGLQLLAMDRFDTQYLWVTARKRSPGWGPTGVEGASRIVRVTDTFTADAVVAQSGRYASATVWVLKLSDDADLHALRVLADGERVAPCFIGKHLPKNPTQVNFYLPPGLRSGMTPVQLEMLGRSVSNVAPMRVIPAGPWIPRLVSVTDAVNLLSRNAIEHQAIKVQLEEVAVEGEEEIRAAIRAEIDGVPVEQMDVFCLDPLPRLYEINLTVPRQVRSGRRRLRLWLGRREFGPVDLELAAPPS